MVWERLKFEIHSFPLSFLLVSRYCMWKDSFSLFEFSNLNLNEFPFSTYIWMGWERRSAEKRERLRVVRAERDGRRWDSLTSDVTLAHNDGDDPVTSSSLNYGTSCTNTSMLWRDIWYMIWLGVPFSRPWRSTTTIGTASNPAASNPAAYDTIHLAAQQQQQQQRRRRRSISIPHRRRNRVRAPLLQSCSWQQLRWDDPLTCTWKTCEHWTYMVT